MADTKIEWAEKVWNPIVGCSKCSPGCLNCYAERMAIRLNGIFAAKGDNDNWAKMSNILKWDYSKPELYEFGKATGWNGEVELFTNRLDQPLHWRKSRRIFVCSMSDLFHEKVPFEFIDKVFDVIRRTPDHMYQILTKRPKRMADFIYQAYGVNHRLDNAWLGVSISNQAEADEKIPILLQIPAAVRWLSIEPLLGEIDIIRHFDPIQCPECGYIDDRDGFDVCGVDEGNLFCNNCNMEIKPKILGSLEWVVVGGESGPKKRLCPIKNIRDVVNQCKAANVPVFVKQIHVWNPMRKGKSNYLVKDINQFPEDLRIQQYPERR